MLILDVLPKISHTSSWADGRGMEFFFADRAAGYADVSVGHWFEKHFLFHCSIMLQRANRVIWRSLILFGR